MNHEFVEYIPSELKDGTIYISVNFGTVVHKCCCGCGSKVVTPLSPRDWKLTFDGETVTLYPSIGNWSFDCKSHYWIKNNHVEWSTKWTEKEIKNGRILEQQQKESYYRTKETIVNDKENPKADLSEDLPNEHKLSFWVRIRNWLPF